MGTIRNLADGSAEIFAEGPEDVLRKFKEKIDRKGDPEDFTRIHVSEIREIPEGQFEWPDKEFAGFEIDYGFEPGRGYERATLEDLEIMKLGAGFLRDDLSMFAVNTSKAFETLFATYGSFSNDMSEIKNTLANFSKSMTDMKNTLVGLKDVIGDFSKRYFEQNGNLQESLKKGTQLLTSPNMCLNESNKDRLEFILAEVVRDGREDRQGRRNVREGQQSDHNTAACVSNSVHTCDSTWHLQHELEPRSWWFSFRSCIHSC